MINSLNYNTFLYNRITDHVQRLFNDYPYLYKTIDRTNPEIDKAEHPADKRRTNEELLTRGYTLARDQLGRTWNFHGKARLLCSCVHASYRSYRSA